MKAILFSMSAAGCATLSNLFFHKNSMQKGGVNSFMVSQYFFSFLISVGLLYEAWGTAWNSAMAMIGMAVGISNVLLMILMSLALKNGPAGATFAFQNASSVFPGLLLFMVFGPAFGCSFSLSQMFGLTFVIFGLVFAAREKEERFSINKIWLLYALGCFLVQMTALTLMQWRCMLYATDIPSHPLIFTRVTENDDLWFMMGFFGSAFLLQMVLLLKQQQPVRKQEFIYGSFGGLANGASTYFLVLATKFALPLEKGILFPCFAVSVIILCSLWARFLYKERFNVFTNAFCSAGILIGSIA